jgi:hypothetical protein
LDQHITKLFIAEVARQTENAVHSKGRLDLAARNLPWSSKLLFLHLENFLNSGAKVSLLLWPTKADAATRGQTLREILKITDDNPLKTRVARNHLQHFDERLDTWAATTKDGNYVDNNTGSRAGFSLPKGTQVLRHYDPSTGVFTFQSEDFDVNRLAEEIQKVLAGPQTRRTLCAARG